MINHTTANKRGFTIIELLVVIAIIIVVPAIVVSNFPQIKNQFALSRAVYKASRDLKTVQTMALSSVPYKDSFGNTQSPDGYGIYINPATLGNKKYLLYVDTGSNQSGAGQYDILDHIIETVDFAVTEPGVIIKQVDNVYNDQVSVNFTSLNANVTITPLLQDRHNISIIFALESDLTKTRSILINNAGLIEIK
jgi:prepilin-type N-terminal cleavage/methylation domain-containing protein